VLAPKCTSQQPADSLLTRLSITARGSAPASRCTGVTRAPGSIDAAQTNLFCLLLARLRTEVRLIGCRGVDSRLLRLLRFSISNTEHIYFDAVRLTVYTRHGIIHVVSLWVAAELSHRVYVIRRIKQLNGKSSDYSRDGRPVFSVSFVELFDY